MQLFLAIVLLAIAAGQIVGLPNQSRPMTLTSFSFTDCGREKNDPIFYDSISVTPDPIVIPGVITVNGQTGSSVNITSPVPAHLKVYKVIAGFPVEIPCVENVGSCDYPDACDLLNQAFDPSQPCPDVFVQNGLPCHCPFPAKNYNLVNVQVPITQKLPPGVGSGDYQVTTVLNDADDNELGCSQISFTLSN